MASSLASILKKNKLIDADELKKALELQKKTGVDLGQLLLKKGTLTEEDLTRCLGELYKIDYVLDLEVKNIQDVIVKIPLRFVQKYKVVPFRLEAGELSVAIGDPSLLHPIDELRLMLSEYHVKTYVAPESELLKVIHAHYERTGQESSGDEVPFDENLGFLDELEDLRDSMDLANEAPIIKMVNVILSNAVTDRASDIHIEPQEKELQVRYRVDGMLHQVLSPPKSIQNGIISRIKIMANLNIAENRLPQDGRFKIRFGGKDIDIRISSLPTQFGERLVLRLLNKSEYNFNLGNIGFSAEILKQFKKLLTEPNGIILITGPTGSGKTTTLYASLTEVNEESRNIITVEDPVEYQVPGISQVQAKPSIGLTFAEGLRSILRQDPDIVMVGEIRDIETAQVAIQSALTGHLVFSTLHTNDSPSAISRLLDMKVEPFLINATTRGIMAQRLLRTLCPHCKKTITISPKKLKEMTGVSIKSQKKNFSIYEAKGCKECLQSGYHGRTGIYELLVIDDNLRKLILEKPGPETIKKEAQKQGMKTLRESAVEKVIAGVTSLQEVLRIT